MQLLVQHSLSTRSYPLFRRYTLPGVLTEDGEVVLVVHPAASWSCQDTHAVLTLLLNGAFMAQALLSRAEAVLPWALLEAYPAPCSYATLHAALEGMPEEDAEHFIEGVRQGEVLDLALTPLRAVLGRCRVKFDAFNLEIRPVDGLSCGLFRLWDWRGV
jgi:hypothetical protein